MHIASPKYRHNWERISRNKGSLLSGSDHEFLVYCEVLFHIDNRNQCCTLHGAEICQKVVVLSTKLCDYIRTLLWWISCILDTSSLQSSQSSGFFIFFTSCADYCANNWILIPLDEGSLLQFSRETGVQLSRWMLFAGYCLLSLVVPGWSPLT